MYRTELMNKILQSEEANNIIEMLSPIYGNAYVALWLFEVIGRELDKVREWVETYELQIVPQTVTWAIGYWEKEYGIVPDATWTLEQRRNNLISTIWSRSGMNACKMEKILTSILGFPVTVDEYAGKNKIAIYVKGFTTDTARAIEFIERVKPAHMIYELNIADYEEATVADYYSIATTVQEHVDITFV